MHDALRMQDLSPAGSIAIGILVGILSTCIQSIGLTLQRKSHLLEDEKEEEDSRRPPYRRRRWQLGMFMFVVSNLVGSTIQITTLPLPVLSTLQASGLVFNTICASVILEEPFTRWSFIGTALVAAGALLIAMFGAIAEPSHTLAQLLELLGRQQFLLWMVGTFLIIVAILFSILVASRIHPQSHAQAHRIRVYKGFAFGGISAILSAHSLLVAKSAVELLVRTIVDHRNQFDRWQSWVILLMLVFFALTQLYFLHRGLKLVSTSILYPFVFCIYNIVAILDGLIYFHQISRLSALHGGLIALGTAVLLCGVLALSWRTSEDGDTPPPPDAHTLLTPGMGLVEDTTTEDEADQDIDADNVSIASEDDITYIGPSETTPLVRDGRRVRLPHKLNTSMRVSKHRNFEGGEQQHAEESDTTESFTQNKPLTSHKRVRSDDLSQAFVDDNGPSSPTATRAHRARTLHGPLPVTQSPGLTWRERDRERRRQRWSRAPFANFTPFSPLLPREPSRSRSQSPVNPDAHAPYVRGRRVSYHAGDERLPDRNAGTWYDVNRDDLAALRRRVTSAFTPGETSAEARNRGWSGWFGRLFSAGGASATAGPQGMAERDTNV